MMWAIYGEETNAGINPDDDMEPTHSPGAASGRLHMSKVLKTKAATDFQDDIALYGPTDASAGSRRSPRSPGL